MTNLTPVREEDCTNPECDGKRTVYSNNTTYCPSCGRHTDIGMPREK